MPETVPAPATEATETVTVPATEAALIQSGPGLSEGVSDYRAAKFAERIGKPKDPVEIPVKDGKPLDPKALRKQQRAAKQDDINEGARKAAQRVVDDYDARIKKLETDLAEARRPAAAVSSSPLPTPVSAPPSTTDDPEPNPTDATKYPGGEYDPKFFRDFAQWQARAAVREYEKSTAERAKQAQTEQAYTTEKTAFRDRMAKARDADPEYDAKLDRELLGVLVPAEEIPSLVAQNILPKDYQAQPHNQLASLIQKSPVSDKVLAYLSEKPHGPVEFQRILREGPAAFYRLEGQFLAAPAAPAVATAPPPKTITDAGPPPPTLGTKVTTPADPIAAAINTGKGSLTGGFRDYRAEKLKQRLAAQST